MVEINKEDKMKREGNSKREGYTRKLAQLYSALAFVFLFSFLFILSSLLISIINILFIDTNNNCKTTQLTCVNYSIPHIHLSTS